jgi:hypothetical protein
VNPVVVGERSEPPVDEALDTGEFLRLGQDAHDAQIVEFRRIPSVVYRVDYEDTSRRRCKPARRRGSNTASRSAEPIQNAEA